MNAINEKYVLKDSMIINQQKSKIVLKYKETSEKIYTSNHDQKSQHLKNGQEGKENTNFISDKKVKLKLKTFSSKQLLVKQPLIEDIKKVKQQKINQLNSVPKSSKSHKQNYNSQKSKQSKINSYFKPSVIFFSLKTNKESEKTKTQSNQLLSEPNTNENLKETKIKKNYSLAAFISQFVHKINQILSSNVSNESIEYSFSYSQFIEILNSLSMVRYSSQIVYKIDIEDQKEELQKVYLLWRIFKANLISSSTSSIKNRRYFLINFIILLAAILRLNVQNVEQLNEIFVEKLNILSQKRHQSKEVLKNEYSQSEPSHIFFVKNKKLLNPQPKITYQGIHFIDLNDLIKNEIFKQFQLFRINRLNTHTLTTMPKQEFAIHGQALEFDLGSFLSPKSQQLAQTKRLKILQEIRKSQPQDNSNKQKFIQNDLNLFLTYKSPRSCENRLMKNYQEQLSENKKQKTLQSKQKANKKQILDVKSPKIKFSQLNVVLNMQKGRKLKQQKQMILQKGWTNNGHLYSIVSNQKQHKDAKVSMKNEKQCNSLNQRSSSNKKSLTNSIHKNFFENRKNSFRGMKILQQKMKNQQKVQQNEERLNNYEQLFLCDDYYQNEYEVKRQIIEPLDDISNSTIPIKDNHQCFDDLQEEENDDEEQREFYQQQDQEHDLIIKNHFQLQNDLKSKQLLLLKTQQNTRTQTQSFQKINSNEQQIDDFNFKSKTFNTQQNQFLEEDSSKNSHNKTQRLSKQTQTRVIKSYLKIPILYVDVNMDDSKKQRIIIYQEDNPTDLAKQFGQKHKLGIQMVQRLQEMLKQQIGGILGRIDEEDDQNDDTHGQIDHY